MTSYDDIAAGLLRLRADAGQPSYAQIVVRIGRLRAERDGDRAVRPGRTTVYDAFRTGRTRVNPELVGDIVRALTDDENLARSWVQRCVCARAAQERLTRDLPAESAHLPVDAEPPTHTALVASPALGGHRATDRPAADDDDAADDAVRPEAPQGEPSGAVPVVVAPVDVPLRGPAVAVLVLGALVANVLGMVVTTALSLPLYLDMAGTLLVATVLGPWAGAATGIASNVVGVGVNGPDSIPFGLVQAVGALVWGYGIRRGMGRTATHLTVLVAVTALACTTVAAPLVAVVLDGDLLNPSHPLSARLVALTGAYLPSVVGANLFYSLVDKALAGLGVAALVSSHPALHAACRTTLLPPAGSRTGRPPEGNRPATG